MNKPTLTFAQSYLVANEQLSLRSHIEQSVNRIERLCGQVRTNLQILKHRPESLAAIEAAISELDVIQHEAKTAETQGRTLRIIGLLPTD